MPNPREPRVLFLTNPEDAHSFVVRAGLQRKGVEPALWHTTDFPSLQLASASYSGTGAVSWEIGGPELDLRSFAATTVWLRRPLPPVLPESIEEADRKFALRECSLFLRVLYEELGAKAFWVNPFDIQRRVLLKPEQLKAATRAGFGIPRTLCSNDPRRIREFLCRNPNGVIYKPLFPASWQTGDGVAVAFTSQVTDSDLPEDSILRATPGIFQEMVLKRHELRITAVGHRMFAAKLLSQEVDSARLDWRAASEPIRIEPVDLPEPVADACRRTLDDLGLVFGCFDLFVTPTGDYVFLEVNEMGAFLWIEEKLPDLGLLDAFCELLIQGSVDFRWRKSRDSVRLQDVIEEATHQLEVVAPRLHVSAPPLNAPDNP